jgi:hypothetical protein
VQGIAIPSNNINPSVNWISAGPPLPFIRISKHNRASSSISATLNSLSRVIDDSSPPLNMLDVVERQVMRGDGVYVDGSIQGIKVTFTADTGAARTVIHQNCSERFQIPRSHDLKGLVLWPV